MTDRGDAETATPTPPPEETLAFFYDYTRGAADAQDMTASALDRKVVQVFFAGAVVVGLVGSFGDLQILAVGQAVLLTLSAVAFGALAVCTYLAIRPLRFRIMKSPDDLWERQWSCSKSEVMHTIVDDAVSGHSKNRILLASKAKWFRYSLIAAGFEVALVGITIVWVAWA